MLKQWKTNESNSKDKLQEMEGMLRKTSLPEMNISLSAVLQDERERAYLL